MKILQIAHYYPPYASGGTEIYTQSLVEALAKKHQLMVMCTGGADMKLDAPVDVATGVDNVLQKIFPSRAAAVFKDTYYTSAADADFIKVIQSFAPDIIHIQHLLFQSLTFIDRIVEAGIPFVMTLHDYWYICPQCFLTRGDGSLCDGPESGERCLACESADGNQYLTFANALSRGGIAGRLIDRVKPLLSPGARRWAREAMVGAKRGNDRIAHGFTETTERLRLTVASLNKAAAIIAPSPVLARRYTEAGVRNVAVIPHGIRTPAEGMVDCEKYRRPRQAPVTFGFIGGIAPHKGVHVLIDAFNRLGACEARLLIYGRSGFDSQYDKMLAAGATNPSIRFKGPFEHEKVFEVLAGIDAVVMPSICAENYPLVANEAFMARTPVIASDVGGLNQLVDDGKNGYLFRVADAGHLAEIMAAVIGNPETLGMLSDNILPVKSIRDHAVEIESIYLRATTARKN